MLYVFADDLYAAEMKACNEHVVDFKLYVIGMGLNDTKPIFFDDDHNEVEIEKAPVFMQGHIKWDGCCNYTFPEQESCMLHMCGFKDFERLNLVIKKMYELVPSIIKTADKDLLGISNNEST